MADDYDDLIQEIGEALSWLHDDAFEAYCPIAYDLCSRTASEHEVELTLDYMLGFCGDDRMLGLFKMICRKYYLIYPEMIASEIYGYREWFEEDELTMDE